MIIPDKLKLNKFREVSLPSPAEYVQRFGLHSSDGTYSGDVNAPMPERKLDTLHKISNADSYASQMENVPENTPETTPETTPEPPAAND